MEEQKEWELERARRARAKQTRDTKRGYSAFLIGQFFVCVALILLLAGVKQGAPNTFARWREDYQTIMSRDMSAKEVKTAVQGFVKDFAKDLIASEDYGAGGVDAAKNTTYAPLVTTVKPVNPLEHAKITSPFGWRTHPITGKRGFHTGLDLATKAGTPIRAAYYGKVEATGTSEAWGNYVLLSHQGGLKTYYCHCSAVLVEQGAVIRAGETIALVGSTGWSTGPHLHFEIRLDNLRFDPEQILDVSGYTRS